VFQLGIDVGGTFTDYMAFGPDRLTVSGKTPSVPGDESRAVLQAVAEIAEAAGLGTAELLANTEVINFGTTVVTNALLEHRGAPAGMLTTKGFRDFVDLRRGYKESLADIRLPPPEPIIRRRDRIGVTERVAGDGAVITQLDEDEVLRATEALVARGIRSFAVCFLQAPANPVHEHRAAELIRTVAPDAFVSLSSEVLNQRGEFERFSATMLNAYLSPALSGYLAALQAELERAGFSGRLLVMQSNGGSVSAEACENFGVGPLLSGPAGGVGGASYAAARAGFPNVIGVDMGGTSYDVSLIQSSRAQVRTDAWIARYRVALPVLDVHTIGAGGGSIAWIDKGGALRVGPRSAGARPGPACYGVGGEEPTVTDANLLLGYLNPGGTLGGRIHLQRALAERAIADKIAGPLSMTPIEAALGVFLITNNNLSNGIRYVSVQRGHDPRDFALVAFGGAAATHATVQARDLGIRTVLVPRGAGVLSAYGNVIADLKISLTAPSFSRLEDMDLAWANDTLAWQFERHRSSVEGSDVARVERRVALDIRYEGQVHELTVAVDLADGLLDDSALMSAHSQFEQMHKDLYSFNLAGRPLQVVAIRQDLVGVRHVPVELGGHIAKGMTARPAEYRDIVVPAGAGKHEVLNAPIFRDAGSAPGCEIAGPAVLEQPDTTILLLPDDVARVDDHGTFVISIDAGSER